MAAKQIIILEAREDVQGYTAYRVAYWIPIPTARQAFYADPNKVSAWSGADPTTEVALLKSGAVVEILDIYSKPGSETIAATKANLQAIWTKHNTDIQARNPWNFYGSFWDGTTWTNVAVA